MIALHGAFLVRLDSGHYAAAPASREQLSQASVVFPGNVLAARLRARLGDGHGQQYRNDALTW
jgi:hypothetical protein